MRDVWCVWSWDDCGKTQEHEDFLGAWIEEFCGMGVPPMKHGQDARAIPAFGVPVILALRWIE